MRTTIEVPINYPVEEAYTRLRDYFGAHGYTTIHQNDETLMLDKSNFFYIFPQVLQDKVILQGFIGRPGKKEKDLDGFYGIALKAPARSALGELQQILSYAPTPVPNFQNSGPAQSILTPTSYVPAPGTLAEKNARLAIWSVVIGAAACLGALVYVVFGLIAIVFGIWLGVTALKTSKRNLAIIGIALNALSAIINILAAII